MSVLSHVVAERLCIGCGVCVVVCPRSRLTVDWNQRGELAARALTGTSCAKSCDLCMRVCPFSDDALNESALSADLFGDEVTPRAGGLGATLSQRVARVRDQAARESAASGGVVTWMLERLLENGEVDSVVAVRASENAGALYEYAVLSEPAEVRASASSAYCPVTLAAVLEEIRTGPDRVAVVGLPCFVKALRLLQKAVPAFKDKQILMLGLACGQTKSRFFTEYIAGKTRPQGGVLASAAYRAKPTSGDAGDFAFEFSWADGELTRMRWSEGIGEAWGLRLFTPRACGFCDDVFAETADACVMDAWRLPWRSDPTGTSFVAIRTAQIEGLFDDGSGLQLNDAVTVEDLLGSQAAASRDKSAGITVRSSADSGGPWRVPLKRPQRGPAPTRAERVVWRSAARARERSFSAWLRWNSSSDVDVATKSERRTVQFIRGGQRLVIGIRSLASRALRTLTGRVRR